MDRVFLDANVLFSAAHRDGSGLLALWAAPECRLCSSGYAVAEARANLAEPAQRQRLDTLLEGMDVVAEAPRELTLPPDVDLAEKDRPILLAAAHARATHLLTGDVRHFGPLFGRKVLGVRVLRPVSYLRGR